MEFVKIFNNELKGDHRAQNGEGGLCFGLWDSLSCSQASTLVTALNRYDNWASQCITRRISTGLLFRCEGNESNIRATMQKTGPFRG